MRCVARCVVGVWFYAISGIGFAQDDKATPPPASPAPSPTPVSPEEEKQNTSLGLFFDCNQSFNAAKGAKQDCIKVSRLELKHRRSLGLKLNGYIAVDPFATTISSLNHLAVRDELPLNSSSHFGLVSDYGVIWTPRNHLEIGIKRYGGAGDIPSQSGLSMAGTLSDTGWDQTALTVTYHLPPLSGMNVTFAAGNGEGEDGENLDPQQYFGFTVDAGLIEGIFLHMGLADDGNSAGSREQTWKLEQYKDGCTLANLPNTNVGYSTRRMAIGASLDGNLKYARGLKAGFGWQKSVMTDISKTKQASPLAVELAQCQKRLDPRGFFMDETGRAVTFERVVLGVNASYRILDTYFFAFDVEQRRLGSVDLKYFQVCKSFDGALCKEADGAPVAELTQFVYTVGAGVDLYKGLTLSLEYFNASYDKSYAQFNYLGDDNKSKDSFELFNARVALQLL